MHIKKITHSFRLSLIMAAILNSAMLDSDIASLDSYTLLSSLRFTQKHSHSTLTLTQTNLIWLIWWWRPSWILLSWIQLFCTKLWLKLIQCDSISFILTQLDDVSHHEFCHLGFNHFEQKKLHSFILTQLDDGSHLEFCHFGFRYFAQKKKLHSFILTQLDNQSHFIICHVRFRHCHLGLRHLVIFSQIHSKTLSLHSDSDSD